MAWQRLVCLGICAVVSAAALPAERAAAADQALPAADGGKMAVRKPPGKTKAARAHHRVTAKPAAATGKTGQVGYASWYGNDRHGKSTASGGRFDKGALTAAHRTLPLESKARVTNMANGRSVMVRITDRGPQRKGRIIDLSQSAAEELGMRHSGVARVHVEPLTANAVP